MPDTASLLAEVAQAAVEAAAPTIDTPTPPPAPTGAAPEPDADTPPAGVSAATALELVAVGYPSMKATLEPLIAAAAKGATDEVFAKAVIGGLQASTLVTATTIRPQPKDNAIKQPKAKGEPSEETMKNLDPTSIYGARNAAMKPARH